MAHMVDSQRDSSEGSEYNISQSEDESYNLSSDDFFSDCSESEGED